MKRPSILFVCLGNICRSPMAEAAFKRAAEAVDFDVFSDSAGTGHWHIGNPPDPRAQDTALAMGVDISGLRARQLSVDDFYSFSHILAMDHSNLREIERLMPGGSRVRTGLLMDYVQGREGEAISDPYYGEAAGFATAWSEVQAGAEGLIRVLSAK